MRAKSPINPADRRIADGARAIARDLVGPAGRIAIDRAVTLHLDFFANCRERGMTWRQIAVTLHAAGAGRANGLPFSENQLSSVVWRRRKHAQRRPGRRQNANAPDCEREASKGTFSSAFGFEPLPRDDRADGGAPEIGRISDRSKRFDGRPNSVSTPDASAAGGAGAFRATLNRAAALRRKVDNV